MSIHQMNQVRTTAQTAAIAVDVADSSSSDATGAFDTAATAAALTVAEDFSIAIEKTCNEITLREKSKCVKMSTSGRVKMSTCKHVNV